MSETPPEITAAPTPAPVRGDRDTFSSRVDAFIAWLISAVAEFNALGSNVYTNAGLAETAADSAASSAANAVLTAGTNATSSSSVAIGTGAKSFTIETGKNFVLGQFVVIAYDTTPANYMFGQITAYDSGTGALDVTVVSVGGSGTYAAWTVSQASQNTNFLPSQSGHGGQFLTTDGATESWAAQTVSEINRDARTSNSALVEADRGNLIDITGIIE